MTSCDSSANGPLRAEDPQVAIRRTPRARCSPRFLGENPIGHLLAPTGVLTTLPPDHTATLTGTLFFPNVVAGPFHHGLVTVFTAAAITAAVAAVASLLRGRHQRH
jgi:hypothetical protein